MSKMYFELISRILNYFFSNQIIDQEKGNREKLKEVRRENLALKRQVS